METSRSLFLAVTVVVTVSHCGAAATMAQNRYNAIPNQGSRLQNTPPTIEAYEALEARSPRTRWHNQKRIWNTNRTHADHAKTAGRPIINSRRPIIKKPLIRNSGRLPEINPGTYRSIGRSVSGSSSASNRPGLPLIQPASASVNVNAARWNGSSRFERSSAPRSGRLDFPSAIPTTNLPRTEARKSLSPKFQWDDVSPNVTFEGDTFANDNFANDNEVTFENPSKPAVEEPLRRFRDEVIPQPKTIAPKGTEPILQQPLDSQQAFRPPFDQQPIDQQPVFQLPIDPQPFVPQPIDEKPNSQQPVIDGEPLYQQPIIVDPDNNDPIFQQPIDRPADSSADPDAASEGLKFDPPAATSDGLPEFRTSADPIVPPARPDPVPDLIRPPAGNDSPRGQTDQPSPTSNEPEKDPRKLQKVTDIFPYFDYIPDTTSAGDDPCEFVCPRPDGAPCKTYAQGKRIPQCPADVPLTNDTYQGRLFSDTLYTWEASNVYHHPLYFEDAPLERYGHTYPALIQPFVSVSSVGRHLVGLPYQMALNPPCKKEYSLGWYRPGECAPKLHYQIPLNGRATAAQAGAIFGLLLFP